jgi:hypothetical protein
VGRHQDEPDAERSPLFRVGFGLFALLFVALSAGCKPNKRYDLIEAELRTRERELAETRAALERAVNLNRAYVQQSSHSHGPRVPDTAPVYIPVKEIALARGTGGVDEDGAPGDEGLMVVVVPKDEDGAGVKVPAKIDIAAWEVTAAGIKHPIGTWEIPPERVRPTWRSGFVSTGYFVAVPWQTYPGTEKVRVAVRLTTLDGRTFEADRDVLVKPCLSRANPVPGGPAVPFPGPGSAPAVPSPAPPGGREPLFPDPIPPGTEELPPPAPAERGARILPPVKQ